MMRPPFGTTCRLGLALAGFALGMLVSERTAALTVTHTGNTNPTLEGWMQNSPINPGIFVGGITGDVGGFDAWRVSDSSTGFGLDYRVQVGGADDANAVSLGWEFSARLRVIDPNDTPDNAGTVLFRSQALGRSFRLIFGSDSDGDPIVEAVTDSSNPFDPVGIAFTLQGVGSVYNEYRVVFDPVSQTADVFVNGIEQISDWSGAVEAGGSLALFGSASAPGTSDIHYNAVSFTFVPEPSSFVLIGIGGSIVLRFRRAARRSHLDRISRA